MDPPFDAVELAARLVRTPGLSGQEEKVATVVEDTMRDLGFREVFRDGLGSVVGVTGPSGARPRLLFDGHMDVVPAVGEWSVDPFGGEIVDGRLWGRGATDMKGGLAAAICGVAAAAAADDLVRPAAVSATVLEETIEGVALARVLDRLAPEGVVICEPSGLGVRIGQRGRAEVLLTARGVPAHAASPERGRNPITLMAQALLAIERMELPSDPVLGQAIIVATDMISDPHPSISLIPSAVTTRFDRRTLPGEEADAVVNGLLGSLGEGIKDSFTAVITGDEVHAYTGERVSAPRFLPAWVLPTEHPLAQAMIGAADSAGAPVDVGTWGFCTNGSESAGVRRIPTVGLGPGVAEEAHIVDESVSIDEIRKAADIYRRLALAYAGEDS